MFNCTWRTLASQEIYASARYFAQCGCESKICFCYTDMIKDIADKQSCLQVRLGDPAAKGSIFVHERI